MKTQFYIVLFILLMLGSCAHDPFPKLPSLSTPNNQQGEQKSSDKGTKNFASLQQTKFGKTPSAQAVKKHQSIRITDKGPVFSGKDLVISAENMSLPAFINEVFGNLLGANFILDPKLQKRKDRVTLRVVEPQSPEKLYDLTRKVLQNYGIDVLQEADFLRIAIANKAGSSSIPPLLVSGATLPDVPLSHRPIFQLIQLKTVRSGQILGWLNNAYAGSQLKIQNAAQRNAIILIGSQKIVSEAARAIEFFDKPFMRGRHSLRIEPAFISATELAPLLVDVLLAQGYGAGKTILESGSILVLPVEKSNIVLLFATDLAVLQHAKEWAKTLDKPNLQAGNSSLFFYPVQNTRADSIAQTLNGLIGGSSFAPASATSNTTPLSAGVSRNRGSSGRIMVDEDRNALLFKGEPVEWQRIMALIKQMDIPAKQVLVEVTIAEVNLNEGESFGVEWFANSSNGRFNSNFSSVPSDGIAGSGLNWILDVAGLTKATLNAFANDSRVKVLSTPRLLVKTGAMATLDVVTEIPTVVGRVDSGQQTDGTTNVLEEVVYRKTGIILKIEPVVHAGNRIDLDITQEVSEVLPLAAGGTSDSPAIFTRNVTTSLSLHSGGSVFLAGLISTRETKSDAGVPFLKDLPILGNLFKSGTTDKNRTELVIMIIPYIINDENDATSITNSLIDGLELIK